MLPVDNEPLANGHAPNTPVGKRAKRPRKAAAKPARKAKAAKAAKPKAKAQTASVAKLDVFGFRKGSERSKAAAIYARPKGATLGEVKTKTGKLQFNVLTQLKSMGHKVKAVPEAGPTKRPVIRYFVFAK